MNDKTHNQIMNERTLETVHIIGYATVAVVLGTADWASIIAPLAVAPIALWALVRGLDLARESVRADDSDSLATRVDELETRLPAADGGEEN